MEEKPYYPIIGPFLAMLRSRAVLTAILTLFTVWLGEQGGLSQQMQIAIVSLAGVVIAKWGIEDSAQHFANRPQSPDTIVTTGDRPQTINAPVAESVTTNSQSGD